nr:MAG TPA: hypothetical protein [Caudoviricetes sp.]DAT62797.1 MAG TPA: hypothetical protein [Caudoviricetes sp.]DAX90986.1 MAG TPA: hypothetical protein [Caudoviricetes sp.]
MWAVRHTKGVQKSVNRHIKISVYNKNGLQSFVNQKYRFTAEFTRSVYTKTLEKLIYIAICKLCKPKTYKS